MKPTKIIWTAGKIIWLIIFILIIAWTLFWFFQLPKSSDLGGVLALTILFASGIYMLAIFIAITILFLLIKFIIKLIKRIITKKGKKKK